MLLSPWLAREEPDFMCRSPTFCTGGEFAAVLMRVVEAEEVFWSFECGDIG